MPNDQLDPKILGQLLLMQSVFSNLPDNKSIFSFVCKGLLDIPGVEAISISAAKIETDQILQNQITIPIELNKSFFGELLITIADHSLFGVYKQYINNFIFVTAVILEERKQSHINEQYQIELEQKIAERTCELVKEKDNLAESQRRFKDMMTNVNLLSLMLDAEGNIIFCNTFLANITEYTIDEIVGKNWFNLFLPK